MRHCWLNINRAVTRQHQIQRARAPYVNLDGWEHDWSCRSQWCWVPWLQWGVFRLYRIDFFRSEDIFHHLNKKKIKNWNIFGQIWKCQDLIMFFLTEGTSWFSGMAGSTRASWFSRPSGALGRKGPKGGWGPGRSCWTQRRSGKYVWFWFCLIAPELEV